MPGAGASGAAEPAVVALARLAAVETGARQKRRQERAIAVLAFWLANNPQRASTSGSSLTSLSVLPRPTTAWIILELLEVSRASAINSNISPTSQHRQDQQPNYRFTLATAVSRPQN